MAEYIPMADPRPSAANAGDCLSTACYICRSGLPSPKSRRTLDAVSEHNRKAVSFLDAFVIEFPIPSELSVRLYICKPCLNFQKWTKADVQWSKLKPLSTLLEPRLHTQRLIWSNTRGNAT